MIVANVLFDARWINPLPTGVGVFTKNLLENLPNASGQYYFIVNPNSLTNNTKLPGEIIVTNVKLDSHPLTEIFENIFVPLLAWKLKCRHFVSPESRVPIFHPFIRTYSIFHDMSSFNIRDSHRKRYTWFLYLNLFISRISATQMITVSNTVKGQFEEKYPVFAGKIGVVPNSDSGLRNVNPEFEDLLEGKAYFLMVGITNKRKNLKYAVYAYLNFKEKYPDTILAVTGNKKLINLELKKNGWSENIVLNLGYVSREKLAGLYQKCQALIYPSIEEGFGIPLLDASLFQKPCLCSNIPVFREVIKNGRGFFDLSDPGQLTQLMEKVIKNKIDPIKPDGQYSWRRSGEELLKIINGN